MSTDINKALAVYAVEIGGLVARITLLKNHYNYDEAKKAISEANELTARIKTARMSYTKILDGYKARFMDTERDITKTLAEGLEVLKKLHKLEQTDRLEAATDQKRLLQQKKVANKSENLSLMQAIELDIDDSLADAVIDDSIRGIRKKLAYEITDIKKIPLDWYCLDEARILEAGKAGDIIPGIRFKEVAQ